MSVTYLLSKGRYTYLHIELPGQLKIQGNGVSEIEIKDIFQCMMGEVVKILKTDVTTKFKWA